MVCYWPRLCENSINGIITFSNPWFITGEARTQATLFPERLDDYIAEENAVRVIDVFIDGLDLSSMGFKTIPAVTGRPAYHPATLLKLYVYGYLNRIQ